MYPHANKALPSNGRQNGMVMLDNSKPDLPLPHSVSQPGLSPDRVAAITNTVRQLFDECGTPYNAEPYDHELHNLCLIEASKKGYPIGMEPHQAHPYRHLACGVSIASTAYGHLPQQFQVFIALYTGFLTWIDDVCAERLEGLDLFYERFISGQKQFSPSLDATDKIIRETIALYGPTPQASLIVMASLRFISGVLLEFEGGNSKMMRPSPSFSRYLRSFTGNPEAYAAFIFPPEVSIRTYMHVLPDMCFYVNFCNDVLSFYKEESRGEVTNYITLEALALEEDKLSILDRLAAEVSSVAKRVEESLVAKEARDAFDAFKKGYLVFHISFGARYRLGELSNMD